MGTQETLMAAQVVTTEMTDQQLQQHAFKVLAQELGLGGLAQFIRLNLSGKGDYTAERQKWQSGLTVDDILRNLDAHHAKPLAQE